jgi:hypothetical protein
MNRSQQIVRGGGGAAVVSHLEHVDPGQSPTQQNRVYVVLDIAGQEEAAPFVVTEQDDRGVVRLSVIGGAWVQAAGPGSAVVRPQDLECGVVQAQRLTR